MRALLLFAFVVSACGGGPRAAVDDAVAQKDVSRALAAYDSFREVDGSDIALLSGIAELVLEAEALSDEESHRDAALAQLRLAGNAGVGALRRLASSEGVTVLRALALEALARRGDRQSRAYLYGMLDEDDPEIVATAITAMNAAEEAPRLLSFLADTDPNVRRAAALKLAAAPESLDALQALARVARVDPEPRVRNAAVRALGGFGAAAVPTLRERLGDADAQVRLAVVRSLVRADRSTAVELVAPLLATPPSRAGIEAARVIALTGQTADEEERPPGVEDARRYLVGALGDDDPSLRSQAAVALVSLANDETTDRRLIQALSEEVEPGVRLGIARALRGRDVGGTEADAALVELLEGDGMPAVQSAVILAKDGREDALRRLETAIEGNESMLRRVAARGMAKDASRPDRVRALLTDDDRHVRIHAAGGILAAVND